LRSACANAMDALPSSNAPSSEPAATNAALREGLVARDRARKALIVGLAQPRLRVRSMGLYYLVRSIAIAPAAYIGGLLWRISPSVPFRVAAAIGLVGTPVFIATADERHAG
jgi:hypothetical protein